MKKFYRNQSSRFAVGVGVYFLTLMLMTLISAALVYCGKIPEAAMVCCMPLLQGISCFAGCMLFLHCELKTRALFSAGLCAISISACMLFGMLFWPGKILYAGRYLISSFAFGGMAVAAGLIKPGKNRRRF